MSKIAGKIELPLGAALQLIHELPARFRSLVDQRWHNSRLKKEGDVFQMTDGRHYRVHKDGSFRRVRPAQLQPEESP